MRDDGICWRTVSQLPGRPITGSLRKWLLYPASMTVCLQNACHHTLKVNIHSQKLCRPSQSEARLLGMPDRQLALIREVILWGQGEPWMLGRTVIPLISLHGKARFLTFALNERPIGEILFSDPHLQRSHFQLARATNTESWLRRSIFTFKTYPVLLTETFLPALLTHCLHHEPLAKIK